MKKPLSYYSLLLLYIVCFYVVFVAVKVLTFLNLSKRKKSSDKSVLFLECMGPPSAGFRHRSQGWVNELKANGFEAESWYVLTYNKQWTLQQTPDGMLRLQMTYLFKRFIQCFKSHRFNTVVIRRELLLYNDYGNLFFEKWMRCMHVNLILDADDDISAAKREPRTTKAFGKFMLEHPQKFRASLNCYDHVLAASDYLKSLFLSWNNALQEHNISVVPTCVDYYKHSQKDYDNTTDAVRIGWVGSAYNLHNLYTIYPALESLSHSHSIELVVICNAAPKKASFPFRFIKWNEESELDNLMQIDIGIMPLTESDISKGKGGFKLIQYMGCGIVSVATALTVNKDIVNDGVNGFLVNHQSDWQQVLSNVLNKNHEFKSIGSNAARTIKERFSYDAHIHHYTRIVDNANRNVVTSRNHQAVK